MIYFLRDGAKKKVRTKCSSTDISDDMMCESTVQTNKCFRQYQCSKVNKHRTFLCILGKLSTIWFVTYRNTNISLRSSDAFQLGHFEHALSLKRIIPKKEPQQYNGFYIEAGAGDGEIISNSLYFEINYKVKRNLIVNTL